MGKSISILTKCNSCGRVLESDIKTVPAGILIYVDGPCVCHYIPRWILSIYKFLKLNFSRH